VAHKTRASLNLRVRAALGQARSGPGFQKVLDVNRAESGRKIPAGRCRVGGLVRRVRPRQHAIGGAVEITVECPDRYATSNQGKTVYVIVAQRYVVKDAGGIDLIAKRGVEGRGSAQVMLQGTKRVVDEIRIALTTAVFVTLASRLQAFESAQVYLLQRKVKRIISYGILNF
jgi:hypothetical protein